VVPLPGHLRGRGGRGRHPAGDADANLDLYGKRLDTRTIVMGDTPVPPGAKTLVERLSKY